MNKEIILCGKTISYEFERKKVKNINVRIRRDGTVYVSANRYVSIKAVEDFLREKAIFILSAIEQTENKKDKETVFLKNGETIYIFGKETKLELREDTKNFAILLENALILTVTDTEDSILIEKIYNKWRKEFAYTILCDYCEKIYPIFEKVGIKYPEIKVRDMVSRWGSCHTIKGILTFNTKLIHAPKECIEYVVVHEFMHFIHPDHSKQFHNSMAKIMPDYKDRRKLLNMQKST